MNEFPYVFDNARYLSLLIKRLYAAGSSVCPGPGLLHDRALEAGPELDRDQ